MHTLAGSAAAVGGNHFAVFILIEHNAQFIQPLDRIRGFHHQPPQQLGTGSEVTAAEGVQIVLHGRITGLVGSLNAAFCHHGIGIADTQLGDHHYIGAGLMRFDGRGSACSAAADDQNIHIVVDLLKVNIFIQQTAVGMEQLYQLHGSLLALIGADLDFQKAFRPVIGVVGL